MAEAPLPPVAWSPVQPPAYAPYFEAELHLMIRVPPDFAVRDMTDFERMAAQPLVPGVASTLRRYDRERVHFVQERTLPGQGTFRLEAWHTLLDDRRWSTVTLNAMNGAVTSINVRDNAVTPSSGGTTWVVRCKDWDTSRPGARISKLAGLAMRKANETAFAQAVQRTEAHYRAR